uniref:Uncharacterized protein n=1 Tax=Panagrolaimus sp. JU765 TaxID=591449 RepID=A0AC34QES3_9BILA
GRYSRAKLADLPSGEEGLFEYQEHFLKCRLPLNFFLENERTNNESLNVSTSSAMSIGRRNPINLHPSLNSEAFGLNSEAFSSVSSTESESERSHDNASNEENDVSRLQQSPVSEAKASNAESVTKSTNTSAVKKKVPKIVIKKNNSNAYRCERKDSKNTSLTTTSPVKSRKSSDKPKPPLKYSEVVPTSLIDEKFANAVEVDRRWGYFNDLKIWVEVPGRPGHVYIYKTKKTELKCKKCRVERRYSRVEVVKNTDGFHRLFEVSNHRGGCEYDVKNLQVLYGPLIEANVNKRVNGSKQNDGPKIENSTKNDDFKDSSGAESSDSVVAISHLLKSDDGRVHNFTKSMKVTDRKWKVSDDERFVWCESQRNSDLWYIYGASGRKPLRCRRCVAQHRHSSAIIVTENSGLKSLWVNENHTSECLLTYGSILEYLENPTRFRWSKTSQSKNQENNVNEQSEVILLEDSSNEENETSMVETSSVIEINSSDDENQTSEFDQSATYGEIYPKQRGFRASHLLDATKIIDRKWEMSDDGRRI